MASKYIRAKKGTSFRFTCLFRHNWFYSPKRSIRTCGKCWRTEHLVENGKCKGCRTDPKDGRYLSGKFKHQ